jgi:hypothetical protein
MATIIKIPEFLAQLDNLTLFGVKEQYTQDAIKRNKNAINLLCKKELDYIRKHVETKTLRRYRSDYRNAIKQHYADKQLVLTHKPKNDSITSHIALKYFTLKRAEIAEYSESEKTRKTNYLSGNRILITDNDEIIKIAINLLYSERFQELAIGLLLLTGRRTIEILKTANFSYVDENKVLFTGQAKSRESNTGGYEIYTLCNANFICESLVRLRHLKDFSNHENRKVESSTSGPLGQTTRKKFNGFLKISNDGTLDNLREYKGIEVKSLRDIWLNIAHNQFKPLSDIHYFATTQLGHISGSTASNYMEFMLIKK